ncbi:rhamnulokinase [Fodinicola acaciae]|uniref:rhamnulokinase n=1 Tax=Fodinicola acaciae TaxID=2681555 RepID=UPI0013D6BF6A|nr:rhamnulokinase family protein [Fodinicola acaciae]
MASRNVVAVDLGAESGRVMLARFDGSTLSLEVAHRFANGARMSDGLLRWDVARLLDNISDGIRRAASLVDRVDSIGVDTWGVDYGFFDSEGKLLAEPVSHRDERTRGMIAAAAGKVGRERLYDSTGIQLNDINTIYQLLGERQTPAGRKLQSQAAMLLLMPDIVHRQLCGSSVTEFTIASTTGAYDMVDRRWATELLTDLGIPPHFLPEVVDAGTDLGPLLFSGGGALSRTRVIAPGCHDTASAVAGVPFADPAAAYISSGTWSLVGVETLEPVITPVTRAANLANEGGVAGTIRLLSNCTGLWMLQECRRKWHEDGSSYDYAELVGLARQAPAGGSLVNPNHGDFLRPGDMPARIADYCRRTGQPVPDGVGATVRCVLESLALSYRLTVENIAAAAGRPAPLIHVVGGGSNNDLLNQLTADAAGVPVHAGPVEATAYGNALVQLGALGELSGLAEMRDVVRASDRPRVTPPSGDAGWSERYPQFRDYVRADALT